MIRTLVGVAARIDARVSAQAEKSVNESPPPNALVPEIRSESASGRRLEHTDRDNTQVEAHTDHHPLAMRAGIVYLWDPSGNGIRALHRPG
jgi:hypothetical protein